MNINKVEELVNLLSESSASEMSVESPGYRVVIRRSPIEAVSEIEEHLSELEVEEANIIQETKAEVEPTFGIIARMVGIFKAINHISVGDFIRKGQIVGVIESVRIPNDVISEQDGTMIEVLVEDRQPVEYGQILFVLKKTSEKDHWKGINDKIT